MRYFSPPTIKIAKNQKDWSIFFFPMSLLLLYEKDLESYVSKKVVLYENVEVDREKEHNGRTLRHQKII